MHSSLKYTSLSNTTRPSLVQDNLLELNCFAFDENLLISQPELVGQWSGFTIQ